LDPVTGQYIVKQAQPSKKRKAPDDSTPEGAADAGTEAGDLAVALKDKDDNNEEYEEDSDEERRSRNVEPATKKAQVRRI
jgi:hypothetical protein